VNRGNDELMMIYFFRWTNKSKYWFWSS